MEPKKTALAGLSLKEIIDLLSPLPRFRAKQIYQWILKGAIAFNQMTNIPKELQTELEERFNVFSSSVIKCDEEDGAKKKVISLWDGAKIEAVLLSDGKKRLTACLSAQAGCPAGCVFCKTGAIGFKRDLDGAEIAEQFFLLRNLAEKELPSPDTVTVSNIVIMGMGEPLLNLANLKKAISVFTDKSGLDFSKRRITVSTCGICGALFSLAQEGPCIRLALSLTTADEELRQRLMPITKSNPLSEIKEALALYQKNSSLRVTLEVPLLGGINTRDKDAELIAAFAQGLETVINIIPWNPVEGLEFEGNPLREPSKKETETFIRRLKELGLKVTTRLHKGRRVMGACGQLGAHNEF